jgi:membrane-associated phospholipid phosphatase
MLMQRVLLWLVLFALLAGCVAPARPPAMRLFGAPAVAVAPPPVGAPQLAVELAEVRAMRATLSDRQRAVIAQWDSGAIVRWNQLARTLVQRNSFTPLRAARAYVLLSVAQHDAIAQAQTQQRAFARRMPGPEAGGVAPLVVDDAPGSYPSDHAAAAGAAATVLASLFPADTPQIEQQRVEHEESRLRAGANSRSAIAAGDTLGRQVATALLAHADADLVAIGTWDRVIPSGPGKWISDPSLPMPPELPEWAHLRPWLMESPDQFRAPPPPAFGSPAFQQALDEVRRISDTRTPEQLAIATRWADGPGSVTPPGRWNQIAADLIAARGMPLLEAARILALLNMAMMDAGIAVWDSKYTYWYIRPFNADPSITTPITRPSHPSYPSGHAGFSGAAAEFLGAVFPERHAELAALAEEAAMSRVYAGIHYRFDSQAGLQIGQAVGQLAAAQLNR